MNLPVRRYSERFIIIPAEAGDPVLMAKGSMGWSDLLRMGFYPGIDESVHAKLIQP